MTGMKSFAIAIAAGLASVSFALAQNSYELNPPDSGGVEVWLSTIADGKERHPFIQVVGRNALRDVKFAILKTDAESSSIIDEGSLGTLRNGEFKNLPSKKVKLGERARFQVCLSFTNVQTKQDHLLVSFLEENAGVAAGKISVAFATEFAAPIRLKTDGKMTCGEALADDFTRDLPHDQRFKTELEVAEPAAADDEIREGLFHVMTFAAYGKYSYHVEMYTQRGMADVEFKVTLASKDGNGKSETVGSRLAYLSPSYVIEPRKMMGIDEWTDQIPGKSIQISACAAYFDVTDQRYAKETWRTDTSLKEQMESPEPANGLYHYPETIDWEFSYAPLRC